LRTAAKFRRMNGTMSGENIQFNRPFLYAKQKAAIYEPKRFSLIEAGTMASKTVSSIIWMIKHALKGTEGWNYWWVASGANF
jgi:hypothetical protein